MYNALQRILLLKLLTVNGLQVGISRELSVTLFMGLSRQYSFCV